MPPHVRSRIFCFLGGREKNKSRESGEFVRRTIVCCGASIVAHFARKVRATNT